MHTSTDPHLPRPVQLAAASLLLAFGAAAQSGVALRFDGMDDRVNVPASAQLNLTNTYTLEAWVRPDATAAYSTILARGAGVGQPQDYIFQIWADDKIALFHGGAWHLSSVSVQATAWSHVAVVVTPTTWQFYLNGATAGNGSHSATLAPGTDDLFLGKQGNLNVNFFDGALDDIRIWNVSRTQAEIQAGMAGLSNPLAETDLVASYEFEGTGQTATDSSANGLHGVLGLSASEESTDAVREWAVMPSRTPGGLLSFNACESHTATIASNGLLNLTNSYSLEAWVRPAASGFRTILARGAGSGQPQDYIFQIWNTGEIALYHAGAWYLSEAIVPTDSWTHVAAVVTPDAVEFYRNGLAAGLETHSTTLAPGTDPLQIGKQGNLNANYFHGELDDVRIWNDARSELEIRAGMSGIANPMAAANLVAYYEFEGSGQTLTDASANGLDGVVGLDASVEATDAWRELPAVLGGSNLAFNDGCASDEALDRVTVPANSLLDLPSEYTLEAWVRPSETGAFYAILGRGTGSANAQDYLFEIWSDGRIALSHGANPWFLSNTAVPVDEWSHVAVVVDASTWQFYLNGIPDGNGAHATTLASGTEPLYLGKQGNLEGNFFRGSLDDVRLWSTARTQAEIEASMAGLVNPLAESDLVASYEFSGSGQTVVDSSANGLDGVLGADASLEQQRDPERRPCSRTSVIPVAACPAGHHVFGGPVLTVVSDPTNADVMVDGSNLTGTFLCGLMFGFSLPPVPLSLIGSTTPGSSLCVDPFLTFGCQPPFTSFQLNLPISTAPGLCGLSFDIQIIDWAGTGNDFGTSQAFRLQIGG